MVDLCYEQMNYMDLASLFAINTENDFQNLQKFVNELYEQKKIRWFIRDNKEIVKDKETKAVMNGDAIITDMISYIRLKDRIM